MDSGTRDQALRAAAEALGCDENAAVVASALDETVAIHEEEQRTIVTDLAGFLEAVGLDDEPDTREFFDRWRAVRIKAGLWPSVH